MAKDRRLTVEEVESLGDRHVQDVADRLAPVQDLEGLAVVARAVAGLAVDVDVGQEVHLDLDGAVAGAGLAPAALHVEREAALLVAADLGLLGLGEEFADLVEDAGVSGGVRARRASDGLLVHGDDLVEVGDPGDGVVLEGRGLGAIDLVLERGEQDAVDQRRLARSRDAGDGDEVPEGHVDGDVLEVVGPRALDGQTLAVALSSRRGDLDRLHARQVLAGQRLGVLQQLLVGARVHHPAAELPRPRSNVDDEVREADGLLIVLDHDDRVAEVAQALEGGDESTVVALVQSDRGLVEDVEDPHQVAANLTGQADPLGLAARERRRGPAERQVVEANVHQERQPLDDLLHDPARDRLLATGQFQLSKQVDRLVDGHGVHLGDVVAVDLHRQHLGFQSLARAGVALDLAHVLLGLLARPVAVGLVALALQPVNDAVVAGVVGAHLAVAVAVLDRHRALVDAVEDELLVLGLQLLPGRVHVEAAHRGDALDQPLEVLEPLSGPGSERALGEGQGVVGDDQIGVDLEPGPEAGADRAGAVGRVEGEVPWCELGETNPAVAAGHLLGELDLLVALEEQERNYTPGQLQGRLDRLGEPLAVGLLHAQPVEHDVDGVLLVARERQGLAVLQLDDLPVDASS